MNFTFFIFAIFALQLICLVVSSKISKTIKNQDDYYLAGKGISFLPLMMTFLATQLGGGMILGAAEEAYHYGWYVILYPMGSSLGFLLLALGLGKRMYQFKVSTIAQIFEVAYGSSTLKKVASGLSIISLFMIFVGQVIASKKFMLSFGVDYGYVFAAFWGIVIIYTVMGGLQAVVATDIIQATFFIFVFAVSFIYILSTNGSLSDSIFHSGLNSEIFTFKAEKFCGWLLMPLLFMVIEQDMGQRCFAAKSGKTVSWATGAAALLILAVSMVPIFFGIFAKASHIEVTSGSSVLMAVSMKATTPILSALIGCAVIAAIISTADSLLNAISSNLMQDFNLPLGKNKVFVSRALTAFIGFSGILVSTYFHNVVDILILSYELSISCLFIPVFAAMLKGKGEPLSATSSILLGGLSFFFFRYYPIEVPREVASLFLSAIGYGVGELVFMLRARRAASYFQQSK